MQAEFRRCLIDLDVEGSRKLWAKVAPHLMQPTDASQVLFTLHYARTQTRSIASRLRYYSHRWLCDNGFPSGLPDELKPLAERMFPKIVTAVGIAVKSMSAAGAPLAKMVQQVMSDAVAEAYADGITEPCIVKERMASAFSRALRLC